jgi:hypothetical protein
VNNFDLTIPLEIPDIIFLNRYHSSLNGQKYLAPTIFELNPRYGGSLPRFLKGMMVAYNKALEQNKSQGFEL